MKVLVETTGNFMLIDSASKTQIHVHRPTLVPVTSFVELRLANGQLRVLLNNVPDSVTDSDWKEFLDESHGDKALAVASFASTFEPVEPEPEPVKKPARRVKKQAH